MAEEFDKSEKATPHKLQEARRKGQVARSPDLTGAFALLAAAMAFYAWGGKAGKDLALVMKGSLAHALNMAITPPALMALMLETGTRVLSILAPFAAAAAGTALLVSLAQTGPVWSTHPLKPDFQRLNPATGFKRIFSMRTLYEAFKSVIKVGVLGVVLYWAVKSALPEVANLAAHSAKDGFFAVLYLLGALALKMGFAAMLLALLDLGYTRFEFARKMRMSKRDLKDEVKHREGDPRIRSRLRGLRVEMVKRAAASRQAGQADVLVVNPTHFAVALRYRRGEMPAPELMAKGAGQLAARMRAEASRHGVPIVRNPPLARALFFGGEMGQTIPAALYTEVARIMVWVFAQRQLRGGVQR